MRLLDRLARLRLVLVGGKGGVGKSTLTVALGRCLAAAGKRVLLLEIDPRESLYPLLDVAPCGGEVRRAGPRLWVQNLRPREVLDDVVRERLRIRLLARSVIASPVYRQFVETAPGLEAMAVLGHALRIVRAEGDGPEPRFDTVVLDAPATGHALSLLAGPGLVADVIGDGPFGEMAGELASFVADPEQAGIVVVTQAEEMPVSEALEMIAALRARLERRPELLLVNGVYPPVPAGADAPGSAGGALELWRRRRAVNDEELARLSRRWDGARIELPLFPYDRGPRLADAVTETLRAALGREVELTCA